MLAAFPWESVRHFRTLMVVMLVNEGRDYLTQNNLDKNTCICTPAHTLAHAQREKEKERERVPP